MKYLNESKKPEGKTIPVLHSNIFYIYEDTRSRSIFYLRFELLYQAFSKYGIIQKTGKISRSCYTMDIGKTGNYLDPGSSTYFKRIPVNRFLDLTPHMRKCVPIRKYGIQVFDTRLSIRGIHRTTMKKESRMQKRSFSGSRKWCDIFDSDISLFLIDIGHKRFVIRLSHESCSEFCFFLHFLKERYIKSGTWVLNHAGSWSR